jgi:uncharacterized protein YgiM (DUF1202 family)
MKLPQIHLSRSVRLFVPLSLQASLMVFLAHCEEESSSSRPEPKPTPTRTAQPIATLTAQPAAEPFVCPGGGAPCALQDPKVAKLIEECERAGGTDCRTKSRVEGFIAQAASMPSDEKPPCESMKTSVEIALKADASDSSAAMVTVPAQSTVVAKAKKGEWLQITFNNQTGWFQQKATESQKAACAGEQVDGSYKCRMQFNKVCYTRLGLVQRTSCHFGQGQKAEFAPRTKVNVVARACVTANRPDVEYAKIANGDGTFCYIDKNELSNDGWLSGIGQWCF